MLGEAYTSQNILDLRRRIGWVSGSFFDQKFTKESALNIVLSGLTGALGRERRAVSLADVKQAKALLSELHIADKIYQPFHMMSKGERENVLIAEPEILLLDEPCTGLDIFAREHLLNTLRDLAENSNLTIIYMTHYTEELLLDVFKKTMLLRDGLVYAQGETSALFTSEVFSDFLGAPVKIAPRDYHGLEANVAAVSHVTQLMKGGSAR